MTISRAFVQQAELEQAVLDAKRALAPDVVNLRYSLSEDWTGEPAIYFNVVLSEEASKQENLLKSYNRVAAVIQQRVEPLEQWGVLPYFNVRSQAEQLALQEEAWA